MPNLKGEIENLNKEVQELALRLQQLDQQRQVLVNEIVKRQGAVEVLQRLDGDSKGTLDTEAIKEGRR